MRRLHRPCRGGPDIRRSGERRYLRRRIAGGGGHEVELKAGTPHCRRGGALRGSNRPESSMSCSDGGSDRDNHDTFKYGATSQ
jgi:hypothetical protein